MEVLLSPKLRAAHSFNIAKLAPFFLCLLFLLSIPSSCWAQDWFRTSTGLGAESPPISVSAFFSRSDPAKSHAGLFTNTVRDDLAFSGIVELASPSFYPPNAPSQPGELRMLSWAPPPVT